MKTVKMVYLQVSPHSLTTTLKTIEEGKKVGQCSGGTRTMDGRRMYKRKS